MSEYRDVKAMKKGDHLFMADGGFTGSAGAQSVRPYTRKSATKSAKPSKPDFARRATTPGGLATGGVAPKSTAKVAMAQGAYAKGGKVAPKAPPMPPKGGLSAHPDVAMDKALVRKGVHKHERAMHPGKAPTPLNCGGKAYSRKPMIGK